jgi:hypothetical protein
MSEPMLNASQRPEHLHTEETAQTEWPYRQTAGPTFLHTAVMPIQRIFHAFYQSTFDRVIASSKTFGVKIAYITKKDLNVRVKVHFRFS